MDEKLNKVLELQRKTHQLMAETQREATIGRAVIELLSRGERLSRAALMEALRDSAAGSKGLRKLTAEVALRTLEQAGRGAPAGKAARTRGG